jgi:excisionase family DNA binding protein
MNEPGTTTMTLLTITEAARLLQISPRTVHRMIQNKKLPGAFKIGGQWRLNESKLAQWLEDGCPQLKDGAMRDL